MILQQEHLQALDGHWAVAAIRDSVRERAHNVANARLISDALGGQLRLDFFEDAADTELLERFVQHDDTGAFRELMQRHAPLVLGVANRILTRAGRYGGIRPGEKKYMADLPVEAPNEATLIGAQTVSPFNGSGDWIVTRPGHWMFNGTGMKKGDRLPGLVGWEFHGEPAKIAGIAKDWSDKDLAAVLVLMDQAKTAEVLASLEPTRASKLSKEILKAASVVAIK